MRVALYYRVSTEMQDFEMQKHVLERWLEEHKPESVRVFQDYAISGAHKDRPAFTKMLKQAFQRKFDTIVCYRLDRLSRSASDALALFMKLNALGIGLICVTQPVLSTVDNPFRYTLFAAFSEIAEIERSIMITRIRDGIRAARARGVHFGTPKKLNETMISRIEELRRKGKSYREISDIVRVSLGSVSKALKKVS